MSKTLSDLLRQRKNLDQFSNDHFEPERRDGDNFLAVTTLNGYSEPMSRDWNVSSASHLNDSSEDIEMEMPCSSETLYIDEDDRLENSQIQRYTPSPYEKTEEIVIFPGNNDSVVILQEKLTKEVNKNLDLSASLNAKTIEVNSLNSLTDDLNRKNSELKSELASMVAEGAQLKGDIRKLNAAVEASGVEKAKLIDEVKRIKREQEEAAALNEQRWVGRDGDRKQADDIIIALRAEIEDKLQLQGKMSNEMLSLERAMGLLQSDNATLRQRIGQIELLDREIAQLRWRINTLEATNADLTAQNSFLRATIASSHPSQLHPPMPSNQSQSLPPSNFTLNSLSEYKSFGGSAGLNTPSHPPARPLASVSAVLPLPPHEVRGDFFPTAAAPASSAAFSRGRGGGVGSSDSAGSLLSMEDFRPATATSTATRRKEGSSHEDSKSVGDHAGYKYSSKSDFSNNQSISLGHDAGAGVYSNTMNPAPPVASGSRSLASILMKDTADSTTTAADNCRLKNSGSSGGQKSLHHFASSASKEMNMSALGSGSLQGSGPSEGRKQHMGGPFATEKTSHELLREFQGLDKQLTTCMAEKTSLQEENEKLLQKGLKTLKERTRQQQIEFRLEELGRDITSLRKQLSLKPS